jgi:cytochrome P450
MTTHLGAARSDPVALPTRRTHPFDPPAELGELREESPLHRLVYPDGHVGWLVTSHRLARVVLGDRRFSIRHIKTRAPVEMALTQAFRELASKHRTRMTSHHGGNFLEMDPPEHTRLRRLLAAEFTPQRIHALRPRVEAIVEENLDSMTAAGPPVDFVATFAEPVPSHAICELLGVPFAARDEFHRYSNATEDPSRDIAQIVEGYLAFDDLIRRVVEHARSAPGSDGLLARLALTGELTDGELAGVGKLLVAAGHHTTKNMLSLGLFALLVDGRRWQSLQANPALVPTAVEELLRYLTSFQIGAFTRTATEDLELDGVAIHEGESVTVSFSAANRDPERFADPDELDLGRDARGHVAFGHGIHVCLGQHLARVELELSFAGLLARFPALRLAVAAEDAELHPGDVSQAGLYRLPVTW